jgi:hypothetical protein
MWTLSYLVALACGWLWIAALRPLGGRRGWAARMVEVSLGAGFGAGVVSVVFFLTRVAGIASPWVPLAIEALLAAPAVWLKKSRPAPGPEAPSADEKPFRWTWVAATVFGAGLLLLVLSFVEYTRANPQGDWDAWNIWNLRAKYLMGQGGEWRNAVSPILTNHPDYPLLTSSFIAQGWALSGAATPAAPVALGALFALATAGLLIGGVTLKRGPALGWMAGAVLMAALHFHRWSAAQYADIPLAFYLLAAVLLMELDERPVTLALAGAFAAFGAWTKNEGIALLAVIALARLAAGLKPGMARLKWFAAGAAPLALFVAWFKIFLAPAAEPLLQQGPMQALARLADVGRFATILGVLGGEVVDMGAFPAHPLAALAVAGFCLGFRPGWHRGGLRPLLATLAGALVCYLAAFLVTPADLAWHAETAMGRLLTQVWPAFVLAFVLALRPLEASTSPAPAPPRA